MKALAKDVDDRYQHASELGEDLRGFMYSTGNAFTRKDLAAFMKATFAEDYDKERSRLMEYGDVKAPEGMLAAAEMMGFGVGHVPQMGGQAQSPSAVTSVPTQMPISNSPNAGTAPGLPPIVRPVPPTLSPQSNRPPSLTSMPRLTAVAPMLTNGKEEHEATVMADGTGGMFDESATNPGAPTTQPPRGLNVRNRPEPPVPEAATDPGRPAVAPPPMLHQPEPRRVTRNLPPAPPPQLTSDTSPTLLGVNYQAQASLAEAPAVPSGANTNTRLIIALAGIVALLIVGLVGVMVMKPAPTGLLMITVPDAVANTVTLNINGTQITDEQGNPIKEWPQMRAVPVGKVTVMLKAPGYEPLIEVVDVKEGNEPAQLKKEMKKKSSAGP